ncbi:hypothetical protein LZC95_20200 [Pendulispora brunnea]|uniref:SnoaL-like domain-containing protein n=1 Tax=Pendulispora brunnea TaxID=2905690 RepID=A0ABZ2KKQ4_9BACT
MQTELLDPLVEIVTSAWVGKGHRAYVAAARRLPRGDRRAHHVLHTNVIPISNDTSRIEANVLFQSSESTGTGRALELRYDVRLRPPRDQGVWPVIECLHASPGDDEKDAPGEPPSSTVRAFRDAYPANRARSFLHAWLASVSAYAGTLEPVTALLEPGFALDFGSPGGRIRSVQELDTWLRTTREQTPRGTYRVGRTAVTVLRDDTYTLDADVMWVDAATDGGPRSTTTRHQWTLRETGERFVRMAEARSRIVTAS